jgi:hypothetical protein
MVEINELPKIKLSQDVGKVTMPGRKNAYRLFGADGHALIDLLQRSSEPEPKVGDKVLCRHPFQESKRAYVIPARVEPLYKVCIIIIQCSSLVQSISNYEGCFLSFINGLEKKKQKMIN